VIAHRCLIRTPEALMSCRFRPLTLCVGFALGISFAGTAIAQDAASFYRGKTIQAVVGYTPGSTFELYLRLFVQHMGRHVPGNPSIIVQHMPGAGSLKATGYLATLAPKDGTTIGMPNPVNTIEPLIDPERSKFDPRQFAWLGSLNSEISTCGMWAKDIKGLDDLKRRQVTVGATGPASGSAVDAKVLSVLLGLDFKLVTGYPGLTEVRFAANRGEVDGYCGLLVSSIKTDTSEELASGRMSVAIQMGLQKHRDFPNVPNAFDLVTKEEDRQLFRLIFGPWTYGRPLIAPPGTQQDRVEALRGAVRATLADPQFVAETKRINLEIQPMEPDAIEKVVAEIFNTPAPVVERARVLLGVAGR
jgi:tripartite-type tricarboxylate transporter receptor subunit TctC